MNMCCVYQDQPFCSWYPFIANFGRSSEEDPDPYNPLLRGLVGGFLSVFIYREAFPLGQPHTQ